MTKHAVVIAGGGPTGLMLAGELALAGVNAAIAERRASTSSQPASTSSMPASACGARQRWSGAGCLPVIQPGEEDAEDFTEGGRLLDPWHVAAVLDHCGAAVREQAGYRDDGAGAREHVLRAGDDQDRCAHFAQPA
jgi:2-polyprenyl-6-methoxyphenol hydroxylase-like FAD-dependent oxidoreductase